MGGSLKFLMVGIIKRKFAGKANISRHSNNMELSVTTTVLKVLISYFDAPLKVHFDILQDLKFGIIFYNMFFKNFLFKKQLIRNLYQN